MKSWSLLFVVVVSYILLYVLFVNLCYNLCTISSSPACFFVSPCSSFMTLYFPTSVVLFYLFLIYHVCVFVSNDFIFYFFRKKIHMNFEDRNKMSLQYIIEAKMPTASTTATPASTTAEPATTTPSPAGPGKLCNNSEPCVANAFCSDTGYCQCNDTYYPNSNISCEESEYSSTTS